MTGCTVRRYEQLDKFPETIEQELRTPTELRSIIDSYSIPVDVLEEHEESVSIAGRTQWRSNDPPSKVITRWRYLLCAVMITRWRY